MFEWWQALVLSLAGALVGGLITLAVSYFQHHWTKKAAQDAEETGEQRAKAAERREATRALRRERVKPVVDFLTLAKQEAGRQHYSRQPFGAFAADFDFGFSAVEATELQLAYAAAFASAQTNEMQGAISRVFQAVSSQPAKALDLSREVELLIERYVIEV